MSGRPRFFTDALNAAIGPKLPAGLTRAQRVAMLGEAAEALLRGELPAPAARLFLAGGLASWLNQGGDLLKHHWRTSARAGSHHTAPFLWQMMRDGYGSSRGATSDDDDGTMPFSDEGAS